MGDFGSSARELMAVSRFAAGAPAKIEGLVAAVVLKSAVDIEAGAKRKAPVDTGFLRGSIGREVSASVFFGSGEEFTAQIGPSASYGSYVEYGTGGHARRAAASEAFGGQVEAEDGHVGGQAPQPFMRPAFDAVAPKFEAAIAQIPGKVFKGLL